MKNAFLIFLVLSSPCIFAQISAYHGIVFPYEISLPQSIGGLIPAIPDFISGAQTNPAGLAFYKNSMLFINVHQRWSHHEMDFDYSNKSISFSDYSIYPGLFSGLLPVKIFNKKAVLNIAVNKIQAPYFENKEPFINNSNYQINHSRDGLVWNTTMGISSFIYHDLSVGLSMTKWFGHWHWHDQFPGFQIGGDGQFSYNGTSLSLGFLQLFKKISFGLTLHSPFVLMKADQVRVSSWTSTNFDIEQKFAGAARFGISYNANSHILLGAGYRYQGEISVQDITKCADGSLYTMDNNYGISHQLNIGGEYTLLFKKIRLPIYIAYQVTWIPEIRTYNLLVYQNIINKDEKKLSQSMIMGLDLNYQNFALYVAAQWNPAQKFLITNEVASPAS